MPRSAPNSVLDFEVRRPDDGLAGFDLGEIEQVVDQLGELFGGLADVERAPVPASRPSLLAVFDQQVATAR